MAYGILTLSDVALCANETELWNGLAYRSQQACLVYKAEDIEELNMMVRLRYNSLMSMNLNQTLEPLVLPECATQSYALSSNLSGAALATLKQSICYGSWAVSGLNGFITATTIEELVGVVSDDKLIYPVAVWAGTPEQAKYLARKEYVKRFFQHFDGRIEQPRLPMQDIPGFIDQYFDQREDRRRCRGKSSIQFMGMMADRVW